MAAAPDDADSDMSEKEGGDKMSDRKAQEFMYGIDCMAQARKLAQEAAF